MLSVEVLNDDLISDFMEYLCSEQTYYNMYPEVYISVGYVLGCKGLHDNEIVNIRNRLRHFVSWREDGISASKV